jgi:hypothetical protein
MDEDAHVDIRHFNFGGQRRRVGHRPRRRMTPAVGVTCLVLATVVFAALGCGGEDDDGMTRWSGAGMSFEYPSSWKELDPDDFDLEGLEFIAQGPLNSAGGHPRISAIREEATRPTIRLYGKEIAGTRPFELNEGRAAGDREIKIPGADAGWRVETRFRAKRKDGSTDPALGIELLAKKDDKEYLLSFGGTEESLREFDEEAIARSFRIED